MDDILEKAKKLIVDRGGDIYVTNAIFNEVAEKKKSVNELKNYLLTNLTSLEMAELLAISMLGGQKRIKVTKDELERINDLFYIVGTTGRGRKAKEL